jgi:hypothetical protein
MSVAGNMLTSKQELLQQKKNKNKNKRKLELTAIKFWEYFEKNKKGQNKR